jgi:two-component system LytT family response regulator
MKALIVDDEFMPAEHLKILVNRHCPEIKESTIMTSSLEALKYLSKSDIDVLFLDIEMPYLSGIDLVEVLPKEKAPHLVFMTAHKEYALKAFELNAIHYLLKPVDPEQLKEVISRIKRLESNSNEEIEKQFAKEKRLNVVNLPSGQDYEIVSVSDIIRLQGSGSYTTFHLQKGQEIVVSKRLAYYQKKLSATDFVRTHQSHLVNLSFIQQYSKSDGGYITLKSGETVPVSKSMKEQVKSFLGI